jgi:alpha-L-rhamnosidase
MDSYVSPFASFYELLARARLEDTPELLDMIRTCWGYMVQTDPASTFWEKMSPEGRPQPYPGEPASQTSLAHAWSAGPTYLLSSAILGVRPLMAGYARAAVEPQVEDVQSIVGEALSWAEGVVPTPQGGIEVRWQRPGPGRCRLEVQIPEGVTADVRFPIAAERILTGEGTPALADGDDEGRPRFSGLGPGIYTWYTPGM